MSVFGVSIPLKGGGKGVGKAVGELIELFFGVPLWAQILIVLAVMGLVGWQLKVNADGEGAWGVVNAIGGDGGEGGFGGDE